MTSVQSHRLLLNGNSLLLILSTFFCLHARAQTIAFTAMKQVPPLSMSDGNPAASNMASVPVMGTQPVTGQKTYTIALLLPFQSDKVFINDLNEALGYYFPEESQLAAAYYQGCLMALDSLAKTGFSAKLLVYDAGMDTTSIQNVLMMPELKNADLIIGPVGNRSLRKATEFSSVNAKWLISPFSTTAIGDTVSPYYLLANATIKTHCEKICDYISRTQFSDKVILLYKKRPPEMELVNYLKKHRQLHSRDSLHTLQFMELTDSSEIKLKQLASVLSATNKNIIIVPSNDEAFVLSVFKQLNLLSDEFLIQVFGMPTWMNFDRIPAEYLLKVSTHITQNYWLDKQSPAVNQFYRQYAERFQMNPSSYAIKGFDQMLYFGALLMKNGNGIDTAFIRHPGTGLAERFTIAPVMLHDEDSGITGEEKPLPWFFENKAVLMLRYEDNGWIKIPD